MPAAATVLALVAASAAGHGTTTMTFDGPVARGLRAQGVTVARQAALPVAAGSVARRSATLRLGGRVTLRSGRGSARRSLALTRWQVRVKDGRVTLTALASGRRRTLLSAAPRPRRLALDATRGTLRVQPAGLRLTRAGARLIRARLALGELPAGVLGTLRVAATVKATGGGGSGGSGGSGSGGSGGGGGGGGGTPPGCTPGFSSGAITPAPAPLARPAGAVDVASATLTWRPRESFIQYINSGEGTSATDGATAGLLERRPGNDARLVYSFGFSLKTGSWYDPVGGTAGLLGQGTIRFRYSDHGIDITVKDPEIELNGGDSRAIFTFVGRDCTQISQVRGIMLSLAPSSPTVDGARRDYGVIPARITDAGASMFSGFYFPGDPWGTFAVAFTTTP